MLYGEDEFDNVNVHGQREIGALECLRAQPL